ncbi:transposase, partial [Holdemanella biformis]
CVLLDFKKQIPVDVLPNRKKEFLLNYFQKIPLEERKKVKYACSDMYEVYRDVVHKVFPNCICLLDYFHLSQDFHKKMNEVRIKVMKGYKDNKASDEYYLLKKFNWLLFKNPEDEDKHGRLFDVERERKYNSHFKSYMNYYDLRKKLLEINNDLTICYSLKLELVDFYS